MFIHTILSRPFARAARVMMTLAAVIGVLCATPAMAQTLPPQGANIYAVADLVPQGTEPDPHVAGSSATFESAEADGTRVTRVTLVLQNMQPNVTYSVDIRDGSCDGPMLYELQPVSTGDDGSGRAVSDVPASVEFGRWHVTVRVADDASGTAVLCGQANPALAGPPVGPAPGMPSTGQPSDLASQGLVVLVGASLAALLGLYFRFRVLRAR
jgi:hypothetical protein